MGVILYKIIPVVLIFFFGYFMKLTNIFTKKDGDSLLKVIFYVALPALIFLSVFKMKFSVEYLLLPVIALLVIAGTFCFSYLSGKLLKLEKASFGSYLLGSLIMNSSFTYPFLIAAKGEESLALASLFDFGNTAMVPTFMYYLACKHNKESPSSIAMLKKFLYSPPLLALLIALFSNLFHLEFPGVVEEFFRLLGFMLVPLMMLALGIYFSPVTFKLAPVISAVFIRMGVGLLLAFLFIHLFDLKGLSRTVVLVLSSAPSGMATLVFSTLEDLNRELAASIISYSVIFGIFFIPLLLLFVAD